MVLANGEINIIADMEGTTGVKLHNNRQKLRARFDIRRKLGQGTYGKVQLAVNKETSEEVAIKTIKKSKIETEQDLVRIQREIQIMSSVQHPHIIHIYEVFENREKIVLVMEYASGGELYDYLSFKKVLTEPEARRIFRQVASAVFYCHKNMICHRDLKLENILLDERGNAKIADFGLSNIFNERNFLSTFCGSPLYASPEIVQGTPYYGPEVDCWSLGVLLYTLVYGAMPFDGSNFKKLVKQISEGDYYEPRVPSDASGLIRKMLTVDPAKRAAVDDICGDRWVDVGEEIPLQDVAQDMCKLMPVRLDYLLALTAAQPPLNPDGTCNDDDLKKGLDSNGVHEELPRETVENQTVLDTEEDDADQWERPALQILDSSSGLSNKDAHVTGDFNKKHKLPSSSSLMGNSSSANVLHKKKKNDNTHSDDDNDKGGGAEKILPAPSANFEAMEIDIVENDQATSTTKTIEDLTNESVTKECVSDNTEQKVLPNEQSEEYPLAESEPASPDSPATEAALGNVSEPKKLPGSTTKPKISIAKKATTGSQLNINTKSKKSQSEVPQVGQAEKDAKTNGAAPNGTTKVPKFKKSIVIGKDATTPPTEATVAATPPSAGSEKRKVGFPPSRVSDARKSFERKSPEKKPLSIPGSKVSSVKNRFESPPTTPETVGSPTKQVPKSGTGIGTPGKATLVKSSSQTNEAYEKKLDEGTSESAKKPAALTRQSSRGNARTSPTKTLKSDKSTVLDQNGQHHRGCVPHEARAAAAQDAKISPPKTLPFKRKSPPAANVAPEALNRKNSLSKTGSGLSRVGSTSTKDAPLVRRPSGGCVSRSSSSSVPRPKSPTKAVRPKTGAANAVESASPPDAEPPAAAPATANEEEATPKTDPKTSDNIEGLGMEKQSDSNIAAGIKNEKRGSIEIAPLPASALVRRYPEDTAESEGTGMPLVRFIPRDQGQFHLLGVKSEVMFDVSCGAPDIPAPEAPRVESQVSKPTKEEDSKIIRYIATVRRHGSSDEQLDDGPERVTLIDLRCSETCDDLTQDAGQATATPNEPDAKTRTKMQAIQGDESSNPEQRGYSMYRSKYRSIQKFRSVVEKRGGEGEEVVEEKEKRSSKTTVQDQGRAPSLERSDSFSSTGSNDDLEDVFESLTSESLFTSLLSRTRNLINRLSEGDAHATRWFQSSLLGRSGLSIGGTIPSSVSSFVFNTPNISVRFNQPNSSSRHRYTEAPKSTYRISARSGCDLGRSNSAREYDSDARSYASDSNSSCTAPRWRSKARKAKEDEDAAFMSDTGASGFRSHQSYSNFNSNRSSVTMSSSSSLRSKEDSARRSRFDTFRTRELHDEPPHNQREDVLAALLRHRNRSLDTRRPRSFYDTEPQPQPQQASSDRASDSGIESLYGTVRRPTRFQRYTKSVSKELSEEYESEESSLHRPRSMVALAQPKEGKSVSVSRDYSKNVSQTGNTKREEEEEYEQEHRVTEEEGGRKTTVRRETKRSVSQTQDTGGASEAAQIPVSEKKPDDFLSRQDSGIGSMHESSTPVTPTSAGVQSRKAGYMRFARSVSNELESLEEEINRMGIGKRGQGQGQPPQEEAEGRATTPASDSAETGSVCSDGAASTDTLGSSQHHRPPEEESVGDRIRRKSFFPRFNETTRIPRKGRLAGAASMSPASSTASMRSELSRASSFRHHFYDEDPAFPGTRYYDPSPDFYSGSLNRNGSTASQRWSMHFGPGSGDSDYPYGTSEMPSSSSFAPRRRGSGGANPDVMTYLRRRADSGSEECSEPGMSRTHSLPEEASPPLRPVLRQHSVPNSNGNGSGNGQPGVDGADQTAPRRPSRLGLRTRNYSPCEETGESLATSPSAASSSGRSWRSSRLGSGNHSGVLDTLEGWDSARGRAGASFASLMGNLESPSEVLQKAMDLCDSLRFS